MLPDKQSAEALINRERFKVLSEMYTAREFRLVLHADVPDRWVHAITRGIECLVKKEGSDLLPCEPVVQ